VQADDLRLKSEIEQGIKIASNAESVWGWSGAAGRARWTRRKEMLIRLLRPHHRVLEVGCGIGLLSTEITDHVHELYSIDISPDLIELAKKSYDKKNITFLCANAYSLEFQDDFFDAVVGMSVLHHLDVDKGLDEFRRVLKPGGHIAFSEPNMLNPQIFLERNFFREYFNNTPDETAFIKYSLRRKLIQHHYRDIVIYPFDFLHPKTPASMLGFIERVSRVMEKLPLLSGIAGSLYIEARK
jgi:ubiquinone/menaquinone biosynthesis C-methylase UbiE